MCKLGASFLCVHYSLIVYLHKLATPEMTYIFDFPVISMDCTGEHRDGRQGEDGREREHSHQTSQETQHSRTLRQDKYFQKSVKTI